MSFVHLHVHSHYSLLDGLAPIKKLAQKAAACGQPALALTDHGAMYGVVEFYQACKKAGIKPIVGLEAYVARNGHQNKRAKIDEKPFHLTLLAATYEGYKNLMKLTTIANLEGFYYKPRIDRELLVAHGDGLVVLSGCLQGELANALKMHDLGSAREIVRWYQEMFGDHYFLEVQHHPTIPEQQIVNEYIFQLATEFNIPVVATHDVHYLEADDNAAQDVLICVQTKKTVADTDRMNMTNVDVSFQTTQQMEAYWHGHPEVLSNTVRVADLCNVELPFGKHQLPQFETPAGFTEFEFLKKICYDNLPNKYPEADDSVRQRLDYELSVIEKTGFSGYFLIVQDFINWAKGEGIVVGPGRGSAAGSIVAYLTNITEIDPIRYGLLFERFLNPERISMPDIDTDFADTRRDDVLRYVEQKYGKDRVAQIITFGTMAARAAIRDVGRVLSLSYGYCDRVAKLIPMFNTLEQAMAEVPELKEVMNEPDGKRLLETALKLEGCVRHTSIHACGVVITPQALVEYTPLQYGSNSDGAIVTQYEMHAVEDLGLLKMDFLGLKNLTILEHALEVIYKVHGIQLDLKTFPLDDAKTYALLQRAETTGVFQLESAGMKRYLKRLQPTDLEDIIAMAALYRPGPMEYIDVYIDGKHGRRQPTYLHPKLEAILSTTYGIAVYQEQIMQIARDLAGFTYGEADVLRKAVGKKIKDLLDEQEVKMVNGMVSNGIDRRIAQQIWEFILPFARYGFNRSHAACYAMIAYQTAYLKANYPAEFMSALMTSDMGNVDRIAIEVDECRHMNIDVLPPDINESFKVFTVVKESLATARPRIRFGLLAIKNVGEGVVQAVIDERKRGGPYLNLEDFLTRVQTRDLNKKSLEALIKTGALDLFGERAMLLVNIDRFLVYIKEHTGEANSGQNNLFAMMPDVQAPPLRLAQCPPADGRTILSWEKELLGLYISDHPFAELSPMVSHLTRQLISLTGLQDQESVTIAGVITTVKKIYTKKGDAMLFITLEDISGAMEVIVFPKVLQQYNAMWREDNAVLLRGTISTKDDEIKVIADYGVELQPHAIALVLSKFLDLSRTAPSARRTFERKGKPGEVKKSAAPAELAAFTIRFTRPPAPETLERLKQVLEQHPGTKMVHLVIPQADGSSRTVQAQLQVAPSDTLSLKVAQILQ